MSLKKTLIVFIVLIVAAGAYWLDQQRLQKNEARKVATSRLVTPKSEDLSEITITQPDGVVQIEKQGRVWRLTKPVQARTDQAAVNSLLGELDSAKKNNAFDPKGKLADFGLKNPSVKIEVKAAGQNYLNTIELGAKTSDGADIYARAGSDPNIFTLSSSFKTQLVKPAGQLRDRRLLPANFTQATALGVSWAGNTIDLAKQGEQWSLRAPIKEPADTNKVGQILSDLNALKVSDFIDSKTLDLAAMGLDKPTLSATLTAAHDSSAPLTLLVGAKVPKQEVHVFAMQKGADFAFTITTDNVAKFEPKLDDLRSKQLFSLKSDQVGRALFNVRGAKLDLRRDSARKWRLAGDSIKLDDNTVSQKIADLVALQATRFFDTPTSQTDTGLDHPQLRITLADEHGKTTETLAVGKSSNQGDFVFARQLNRNLTVGVDWQQPGKFYLTKDDLIDKTMFNFDAKLVQKVVIAEDAKKMNFTREKGGGWTGAAEGSGKTYQVEGPKMLALVYDMAGLSWNRRLDPKYPTDQKLIKDEKLDSPTRTIVLLDAEGKDLARLGQGGEQEKYLYVRCGEKDYFAIDKMRFASIKSSVSGIMDDLRDKH